VAWFPEVSQELLDAGRGQVGQEDEATGFEDSAGTGYRLLDMLRAGPISPQSRFPLCQVFGQWPLVVGLERVADSCPSQLSFPHQISQQLLRGHLVG
jgi:hypothetical protein